MRARKFESRYSEIAYPTEAASVTFGSQFHETLPEYAVSMVIGEMGNVVSLARRHAVSEVVPVSETGA
ncbi:hypothetical protein ACMYR2_2491 [Nitrobacter sp. TKz-YC01]